MVRLTGVILLMLGLMESLAVGSEPAAESGPPADPAIDLEIRSDGLDPVVLHGQPVRTLFAPRIDRWYRIGWQRLVLYIPRSGPYLITLKAELNGQGRAAVLDPQLRNATLDARFDNLFVRGFPYGIQRIEKIDEETARRIHGDRPPERRH